MHEYGFALRDVENTLKYLDKDGVIIMHDCNPVTREASVPFEDWEKTGMKTVWNGDVWKAVVHLRSMRTDVNVFVLDCDHGLGIITRRKPESTLDLSEQQIKDLSYEALSKAGSDCLI